MGRLFSEHCIDISFFCLSMAKYSGVCIKGARGVGNGARLVFWLSGWVGEAREKESCCAMRSNRGLQLSTTLL